MDSKTKTILDALEEAEIRWTKHSTSGYYNGEYFTYGPTYTRTVDDCWKEAVSYGIAAKHPHVRWERATAYVLWRGA